MVLFRVVVYSIFQTTMYCVGCGNRQTGSTRDAGLILQKIHNVMMDGSRMMVIGLSFLFSGL
jgi:hypothetical protein